MYLADPVLLLGGAAPRQSGRKGVFMSQGMKHGSETFFIEGEGVLTTQLGGRTGDEADPVSTSENPKDGKPKALPKAVPAPFHFSRVGPKGTPLNATITRKLAKAMTVGGGGPGQVPAGYTYLGQFVDHDLTMDRTDVMLGEDVTPEDLVQGRSPRLDLDSLYGAGPADPASAKFYAADGLHLKTGTTIRAEGVKPAPRHDLPRVGTGGVTAAQRALIPDPRNDENLIVAQTHTAMISFHNKVVDRLPASMPAAQKFTVARKRVPPALQGAAAPRLPPAHRPAGRGERRVHHRPQADPARRDPDRHPDD